MPFKGPVIISHRVHLLTEILHLQFSKLALYKMLCSIYLHNHYRKLAAHLACLPNE